MQGNATNEPGGVEWGEGGWVPLEQPCQFTGPGMVVQGEICELVVYFLKTLILTLTLTLISQNSFQYIIPYVWLS